MQGYKVSILNEIANNLRERYDNGFPILKELIQNADDARARSLVFGRHEGFPDARQTLLRGPGLWVWNDGTLKEGDLEALTSFGINSKAGDATTIGKFGLGMKSVFHLCEAFFYLAWDGGILQRDSLSPWTLEIHPDWDTTADPDWQPLENMAQAIAAGRASGERHWFLLWLPLRRAAHLQNERGATGAIIQRFPGDSPHTDLAFLEQNNLPLRFAEMLPLLRHLERIEYCPRTPTQPTFTVALAAGQRLAHEQPVGKTGETQGRVRVSPDRALTFTGFQQQRADPEFVQLKAHGTWPRSFYRDWPSGQERSTEDKARPEATVLFARATDDSRFSLRWAVFLPLDKGEEQRRIDGGWHYRVTLHGQFFVDSGRRGVHGFDSLHEISPPIDGELDEAALRLAWNAHLAQRGLAPLVLPALARFVQTEPLDDAACRHLTDALQATRFFERFRAFVCGQHVWCRVLNQNGPVWELVGGADRERLRPFPAPPKSDPQRPWQVFSRLPNTGLIPFEAVRRPETGTSAKWIDSPRLFDREPQWQESELANLLAGVSGVVSDGPRMDYLAEFLESGVKPLLATESLEQSLIELLRTGLIAADRAARQKQAEKSRRLIGFVAAERRLTLDAELPEPILCDLWRMQVPILLVPKGLEPKEGKGKAVPSNAILRDWLAAIDQALATRESEAEQSGILTVVQGLLKSLDSKQRGEFLRTQADLRVIAVRDARSGRQRAVSCADIQAARKAGTLFGFAQGQNERDRLGLLPQLARTLPQCDIWIVRAEVYEDVFPGEPKPPRADSGQGCLAAIGKDRTGRLGNISERRALLEKANDPGADASTLLGLRYLLHGSADHRHDDQATLWIPSNNQHSAWSKLWDQLYGADQWSRVPTELADALPRGRWTRVGIREIQAASLLDELRKSGRGIPAAGGFTVDERDEILSHVSDQDLWQRLPLHTTVTNDTTPVSATGERVYLAPDDVDPTDPLIREATLIRRSDNLAVADKQQKWLRRLDDRARLALALGTAEPSRHWRAIMDALASLQSCMDSDPDVLKRLRERPWLPTRHGWPVKPEDVLELAGGLADEVRRLVAEHRQSTKESCFVTSADLDAGLADHSAWDWVRENAFSTGEAGLGRLARLLKDLPGYRIGSWSTQPKPDALNLLARCDRLPGWRLLQQAALDPFDLATAWRHLRDGLTQPLTPECLSKVLKWITAETTDWEARKAACDGYLSQWTQTPDSLRAHLAKLRFASRAREWRSAAELCAGAPGIDANWLLDDRQSQILDGVIHRADRRPAETASDASIPVASAGFDQARQAAVENRNYSGPVAKQPAQPVNFQHV